MKVHLGEVVGDATPTHHPDCVPLSEVEAGLLHSSWTESVARK